VAGDFELGIQRLIDSVGDGELKGSVEVDQIYAHIQHEDTSFKHPHGGTDHYLQKPLFSQMDSYMEHLAEHVVTEDGGSGLQDAMADNMEELSKQVEIQAPIDISNLRRSGHPTVTDNGETVYDRAPQQSRLSEGELKELRRARNGG
jgi:hypothetical protein